MSLTRRRFIGILAATASLPLSKSAHIAPGNARGTAFGAWRGQALGAEASINLHHPDKSKAEAAIRASLQEIQKLERIFSLFRADAAIVHLNSEGRLDQAPPEMIELLRVARWLSALSDGAFDITVQPLWQAYAQGRDCRSRASAIGKLIDWRGVIVESGSIRFKKPGMAITLNGIAQGYMTDRIVNLLKQRGFANALVHMGEYRGLGQRDDGLAWQIGIADPKTGRLIERVDLTDQALATSSPFGTSLSCTDDPVAHHLFDPKSGRPADHFSSVSVVAKRAVIADGLSTAVAAAPFEKAPALLKGGGAEFALLLDPDGRKTLFQSEKS